jgi:hypothetical protein
MLKYNLMTFYIHLCWMLSVHTCVRFENPAEHVFGYMIHYAAIEYSDFLMTNFLTNFIEFISHNGMHRTCSHIFEAAW